jgi:hypothetical protein
MQNLKSYLPVALSFLLYSCSTMPKASHETFSTDEARNFLQTYCSSIGDSEKKMQEMNGEILVRSSTREFKGQYPASIHFSKEGSFSLEVTNVIGGTIAMLKGGYDSVDVISSSKPQYNQKSVKQYMGLPVKLLAQLLHGDLPCPSISNLRTEGEKIVISDGRLEWQVERSDRDSGAVPYRARIYEGSKLKIDLIIERWNAKEAYAEKVRVTTPEGDLKWTWRSRNWFPH